MQLFKSIFILFAIIGLSGCAGIKKKNILLPEDFMVNPTSVVIGRLKSGEEAAFYTTGFVGILDSAIIASSNKSLSKKLENVKSDEILRKNFYNKYSKYFASKNFKVRIIETPLEKKKLSRSPIRKDDYAYYDYRYLKNEYNVRHALILDLKSFGVTRNYYGFAPTGRPEGMSNIIITLVDLEDNKIIAKYEDKVVLGVNGKWDEPDFNLLIEASKNSIIKALEESYAIFAQ